MITRLGLIQHNPVAGDFPRQVRSLIDSYRECVEAGAEVVLSGELSLPGVYCQDLRLRSAFMRQAEDALSYMAKEVGDVPLGVGIWIREADGRLEKGYALLQKGVVIEKRAYSFDQKPFATEWKCAPDFSFLLLPEGVNCPAQVQAQALVWTSSQPWYLGKERAFLLSAMECAKKQNLPLAYVGCVGAHDEKVYNGESFFLSSQGELLEQLAPFEEGTLTVSLRAEQEGEIPPSLCKEEYLYRALTLSLRDYCQKTGMNSVCLGLSGGIDSALVAALAVNALGAQNVVGITMPSPYSSQGSVDDSLFLAKNLGITCHTLPIHPLFETLKESLEPVFEGRAEDVTEENMQSRLRGLLLMSFANKMGHMLLSTGNKSEIAVGYCTLYGDTCGGIALIGDLYKHQVYALSRWINRESQIIPWSTIDKAPSAELRPDQKDEDSLPPYPVLDRILAYLIEQELSPSDIIARTDLPENDVRWVQRRLSLNEWKRQQAALIPQVSPRAFGKGREYPVVHNFRD